MTKIKPALWREYLLGFAGVLCAVLISLVWVYAQTTTSPQMSSANLMTGDGQFIQAGPFTLSIRLLPSVPQVGPNQIIIQVRDAHGQAVAGAQVRAVAEHTANSTSLPLYIQVAISESSPGVYQGDFELPHAGEWPLAVDVATDEQHHADLSFTMATHQAGLQVITQTPVGEVAYHTCSMHPSVKSAEPGSCPICGMDLIPITRAELESGSITVDESRRQMIGIKTGQVRKENFRLPIQLYGEVSYDQTKISDINLLFDGWIGTLNADYVGKRIQRGTALFSVYSPELLSLQEEHLETIKRYASAAENSTYALRIQASRKRLSLWGLTADQIEQLEHGATAQDYMPLLARNNSVVLEKNIVQGSAFKRGQSLLRLVDLSSVWVEAHAYEQELALLQPGMSARVRLSNLPDREFSARIMQIDPFLQNQTRSARVRFAVDNTEQQLSPGLFAQVSIAIDFGTVLLIPTQAVLISGEKRLVFLDLGQGRLKPQLIRTGYSDGENIVVRSGLRAGDHIVTSGNFLIAAESKLKAGIEQW